MTARQHVLTLGRIAGCVEGRDVRAHLLIDQDAHSDVDLTGSEETQRGTIAGADDQEVDVFLRGRFFARGAPGAARIGCTGKRAEIQADLPEPEPAGSAPGAIVSTPASAAPSRNS